MKNVFGTATTNLDNDLTLVEAINLLSGDAESVLCHVLLQLDAEDLKGVNDLDPRGVELVADEEFNEDAIEELKESNLVLVHEDSDEETSYVSVNKDVFYAAINSGVYETFDLCG